MDGPTRYRFDDLQSLAGSVLERAGLDPEKAGVVARGLVEGDMMGATTHGLALLAEYARELEAGTMTPSGGPEVINEFGALVSWDGRWLPGVWLIREAVWEASRRAASHGIGLVTVRRSHHIAGLGHYLLEAVARNEILFVFSSDPSDAHVAPFGGLTPVLTPNPIAVGIPARPYPILVDASTSITTAGMCERCRREKRPLPGKWLLDRTGGLSDDPNIFGPPQGGTILPVGGLDHGHKGYGLSLVVEAVTQGLAGFGRPEAPTNWGAAVTVQIIRPEALLPMDAFLRQTDWLVETCLRAEPRPGVDKVLTPGRREMENREEALKHGVVLYPGIAESLAEAAEKYGLVMPGPKSFES